MLDFIREEKMISGLILLVIALIVLMVWAAIEDAGNWAEFSQEHDCKKVSHVTGDTSIGYGYGVTTSGKVGMGTIVTSTPSKTGWLCDDGVTYYR